MDIDKIATKADIENLIIAIENLGTSIKNLDIRREFLRSADVRKQLNISDGTLQRLRITGALLAQKVNGTWFYKYEDVVKMLNK